MCSYNQIQRITLFIGLTILLIVSFLEISTPSFIDFNSSNNSFEDVTNSEFDPLPQPASHTQATKTSTNQQSIQLPTTKESIALIYGDYIDEASQETPEVWETLFRSLGYDTTAHHISSYQVPQNTQLLVILPSIATQGSSFGITIEQAQTIGNTSLPILLLGYAHEVLDLLWGFDPTIDHITVFERYLWATDPSLQIFNEPHPIVQSSNRLNVYSSHVSYNAYRLSNLPSNVDILGTNLAGTGAQLLWFREFTHNSHLYYWGLDQTVILNTAGKNFLDNLVRWLLRPPLSKRLGQLLNSWQLDLPSDEDFWAIQGGGGFGYPLEPSIFNTYYVADMVTTHELDVNISNFDSWLITHCYNLSMGCFEDLSSPLTRDRCVTTAIAVLTLDILSSLDSINLNPIRSYLLACQDSVSGGFLEEQGSSRTSLRATHYALHALDVLGVPHLVNQTAVSSYVASCQELDPTTLGFGGFYSSISGGLTPDLISSLYALDLLNILNAADAIDVSALLSFITACEDPWNSGIFDTKTTFDSDEWILGTACTICVLDILNETRSFNIAASRSFLISNQYSNGGWGRGDILHDFHNSPDETWFAAQGLTRTGGLDAAAQPLKFYLANCCTSWGGASEPYIFGDFLTSWHLLSILYQVGGLSAINLTAFFSYLGNCWIIPHSSFGWHQVPKIVTSDTDTLTPDRMAIECGSYGPLYHYAFANLVQLLSLENDFWLSKINQVLSEIRSSQTLAPDYAGMFGASHLYVGQESDLTFRFDGTCWSLIAHQILGGDPADLIEPKMALTYLTRCLQDNGTHQYFHDSIHQSSLPAHYRYAQGDLTETWLGLQAYSYLDPDFTLINGTRMALYASKNLRNTSSLITAYYATEILQLLAKNNLILNLNLFIDKDHIKALLESNAQNNGLFREPDLPSGRWTPYLSDLAFQLTNRFHILPSLDVNPFLNFSQDNYPYSTIISITNYTPRLYLGENLSLDVTVATVVLTNPNGTASLLWDGVWQHDFTINRGLGSTNFIVPFSDLPGEHILAVLFGHLDSPNIYLENITTAIIWVQAIQIPSLSISLNPTEVENSHNTPEITVTVSLTYLNRTVSYGLKANITLQLQTSVGLVLKQWTLITNQNGTRLFLMPTPSSGSYLVFAQFKGLRGYASSSAIMPLLVYPLQPQIQFILSPIIILSLLLIIGGLVGGALYFKRLEQQARRLTSMLFLNDLDPVDVIENLLQERSSNNEEINSDHPSDQYTRD